MTPNEHWSVQPGQDFLSYPFILERAQEEGEAAHQVLLLYPGGLPKPPVVTCRGGSGAAVSPSARRRVGTELNHVSIV